MKKKIKDLTKEERELICKKSDCKDCPFSVMFDDDFGHTSTYCFEDRLDDEVEVPEEQAE